jgi:threonine/homoserine efflux transporter RhtA
VHLTNPYISSKAHIFSPVETKIKQQVFPYQLEFIALKRESYKSFTILGQ